jgi:outer membrane protein OmpA-like peptidoglycan-associated protein
MRILLATAALLCALAVLARPAGAATTVTTNGAQLTITAAPGIANHVTIGPGGAPGTVRVDDAADSLALDGTACVAVDAGTGIGAADCPATDPVAVDLGDGDDTLSAAASPVALRIAAGAGDDTVDVANDRADAMRCGDDADTVTGADDPQDALAADCEVTPPAIGPPQASVVSGPAPVTRDTSAAFTFGARRPASFQCALDTPTFAACDGATTFSGLAEGPHVLLVRAVDLVGNTDPTPSPYTWTQDSVRPQTDLTGGPASSIPVNSASATFTFASPDGARFECSLDGSAWAACASPATYGGLANGSHAFAVRAVDAAGNVDGTPATRAWTVGVDGAPVARISVARDGDGFALSAAGSSDPDGTALTYRWQRNGAAAGSAVTLHYAAPDVEARDVFTVTVADAAGRRGQATVAMSTRATTQTAAMAEMQVVRFAAGTRLAAGAAARIAALRGAIASRAARVRIEGYSRPAGNAGAVSKARARAVRALLARGVTKATAITVAGRGSAAPAASNATAAGRARNDRVVVTVTYRGPAPRLVTEQEGNGAISASNAPPPAGGASGPAPKLFAFYSNVPGGLRRLEEVGSRVAVLAPNWYTLSPADAAIHGGRPNARVTKLSRTLGFAVWPVVNATMHGSPLVDTPAGRATIVARIGALAAKYRLAGVTLDMEEMLPRQKASYSALVAQLAAALHAAHRKLAIYAVRRTADDVDDGAAAYDWPELARAADLVLASGYNEHSATTAPGPVTTRAGFAALAAYAAATSRAKVAPTMGAFGYQWTGATARMISSADAERRWPAPAEVGSADDRSAPGATPTWYESAEDLWAREQAARRAGARWIGLFSLGREPERFWERSTLR